jgi:hypothetical protein
MLTRSLFAFGMFTAAGFSQTFVVDLAGGPGVNFTNLQVAVDTVPDGAVLLIRPGGYANVSIHGKGLSLLATGSGVYLGGLFGTPILAQNLTATQPLTLRGLSIGYGTATEIDLRQCAGPVLIEDFHFDDTVTPGMSLFPCGIAIDTCAQLTVRDSRIVAYVAVSAVQSNVVIENCELVGQDAFDLGHTSVIAGTGAEAFGGSMTFARCRVRGGNGLTIGSYVVPPASAIHCDGAEIRICDDSNGTYTAGALPSGTPIAAIDGPTGTVVREPSAVVVGSSGGAAVASAILDVVRPLPSLHTASTPGAMQADVTTPIGETTLLAFGLPGAVTTVPGVDGTLWLDPTLAFLIALGVPQPGAPLQYSIAVPPALPLLGVRFAWQAVADSAAHGLRFSNPSLQTR